MLEDGTPVLGFDPSGCPIKEYKDDDEPVLAEVKTDPRDKVPLHGYDKDGKPMKDCFDADGKPING